jgi:hypothetical protein
LMSSTPAGPSSASLPEPLAVWDVRDRANLWWCHADEAIEWAARHINDPNSTFRVEFYLVDAPFAVLYRYAENDEGRRYMNPETDEPATEEPVVQMLDELPPRRLLVAC